jgi:sodium-dependent phosphate transporter
MLDTANATGPFSAVYTVYQSGLDACADDAQNSHVWIMALAGIFVAIGVITLGYKVIETVGKNLTLIDFEKGFCIEFSSVTTVLLATMLELPVSTTHCQIGAVVAAGWYSGGSKNVKWALFARIGLAWVLTIPFSGLISFAVLEIFRSVLKK